MDEHQSLLINDGLDQNARSGKLDSPFVPVLELSFENITYSLKEQEILRNISGNVSAGESLAIMGPSGAGKTTLLNILAGRTMKSNIVGGTITLNGVPMPLSNLKEYREHIKYTSGYVMQQDCLMGSLTVKETLQFYADLRLPRTMSTALKKKRVENTIHLLGLKHIENSRIGTALKRGISGGERKRVSIAVELITKPALLFLDEPTTGLDGYNAMSVMNTAFNLAKKANRAVVFTIHQPRSFIFQQFDKLLLISKGQVIYFGPSSKIYAYFNSASHPIPLRVNPADYLLDIVTLDSRSDPEKVADVERLVTHFSKNAHTIMDIEANMEDTNVIEYENPLQEKTASQELSETFEVLQGKKTISASMWTQLRVLIKRNMLNSFRSVELLTSILIALIMGSTFYQLGKNQGSVQDRINSLFFLATHLVLSAYTAIPRFIEERLIFNRERASGTYSTFIYFIATTISEFPLLVLNSFAFATVTIFMIGLNHSLSGFFFFQLVLLLISLVSESLANAISSATPSFNVATAAVSGVTALCLIFGGFGVKLSNIIIIWKWVYWASYFQYGFTAMTINEFTGLTFDCGSGPLCPYPTGEAVLASLDISDRNKWECVYILCGIVVLFKVANYFVLRFLQKEKN